MIFKNSPGTLVHLTFLWDNAALKLTEGQEITPICCTQRAQPCSRTIGICVSFVLVTVLHILFYLILTNGIIVPSGSWLLYSTIPHQSSCFRIHIQSESNLKAILSSTVLYGVLIFRSFGFMTHVILAHIYLSPYSFLCPF